MPNTAASDSARRLRKCHQFGSGCGGTRQIALRAACRWVKTPIPPKIRVPMPTTVATVPVRDTAGLCMIAASAALAWEPASRAMAPRIRSRASVWLKTAPAIAIASTRSGAMATVA